MMNMGTGGYAEEPRKLTEETITEETAQGMAGLEYWLQSLAIASREGYTYADAFLAIPKTESATFASANGL